MYFGTADQWEGLSGHVPTLINQQQADISHTARVMTSQSWKFCRNEKNVSFRTYSKVQ